MSEPRGEPDNYQIAAGILVECLMGRQEDAIAGQLAATLALVDAVNALHACLARVGRGESNG